MAKPIATVQLGIARLGLEISDCATDADLVAWVKSFHRALALQKPELNAYAAELLAEVDAYRQAEADRKAGRMKGTPPAATPPRNPAESGGSPRKDVDSLYSQSASHSASQSLIPERVAALVARYPATRPRPEREGGSVAIDPSEQEIAALTAAVTAEPAYPWEAAVESERGKGMGIRNLARFVTEKPAPTARLIQKQARITAPTPAQVAGAEAQAPLDWPNQGRFEALTRLSMLPGFKDTDREELKALTAEYMAMTAA